MNLDLSAIDSSLPLEAGFARYLAQRGVRLTPPSATPHPLTSFQITVTGSPDAVKQAIDFLFSTFGLTGEEPGS